MLPTGRRRADRDHVSEKEFSDEEDDDEREMDDFHLMCQEGGRTRGIGDGVERLGIRDTDRMMDWHHAGQEWGPGGMIERVEYLEIQKKIHTSAGMSRSAVDSGLLNWNQRRVYDKIVNHATARLHGNVLPPFLLNVDGTVGTGKSFLIDAISQRLESLRALAPSPDPLVRRLAPTGVATFNISGLTP